jgi:hypothetical protein
MTGGLIQLVSYGVEDLFLINDPQITLFKLVYKRHTNFSIEAIPQHFVQVPNFNNTSSCIISKQGDLIGKTYLVLTLPKLAHINKNIVFAWSRKIGLNIIKKIKILIGGQLIDEQYGEWLNIWAELIGPRDNTTYNGYNKMIGNIPELYNYSSSKEEYTLHIPLQFWFCRDPCSYLPLISLQYNEVQINLELNDLNNCLSIAPDHYIETVNDISTLKEGEYIEQYVDDQTHSGVYNYFDTDKKRLYYKKISPTNFEARNNNNNNNNNTSYYIYGLTSKHWLEPKKNTSAKTNLFNNINFSITKAFLLVDYIYLDDEERKKIMQSKQDFLIEKVENIEELPISSNNNLFKINLNYPCKFFVWTVQYNYIKDNNDPFNYTDSYKYINNKLVGKSLIQEETFLLNDKERISIRDYKYFNYIQPYQYFEHPINEGINVYSFSIFPYMIQPSGSCNMSQLDNIQIKFRTNNISLNNKARFRGFALVYNILRIVNGLSGLVFD